MSSSTLSSNGRQRISSFTGRSQFVFRLALSISCVLPAMNGPASETLRAADKAKGVPTRWGVKADPPAGVVTWPETLNVSIPQPARFEEVLFPTRVSEFCLVGLAAYESDRAELWNLVTGQRAGAISGTPPQATKRALSPDGKYLALALLDRARANDVEVWSLETGKRVSAFTADDRKFPMTILDFAGPEEVLTYTFGQENGKFGYHLRVWDAQSGAGSRQMDLDKNISGDNRYDVSPGGNWLASIVIPEVVIYDLQTGQAKGSIAPPEKTEGGEFVHINSVRFSPDGTEIALLSEGSKASVITVRDLASGDVKLTHELPASMKSALQNPASYKGPHLEFVSQPAGFLWYGGAFIERDSGLMVWTYRQGQLEHSHWKRLLTPAGLIISTGGNNSRKVNVVPFPSAKLQKTLDAYRSDGPALLKPGAKVRVTVKVGEVRFGKPEEAKQSIETVLAERLADDGLEVSDDGGTVMAVEYKETAGKTLQEVKGGTIRGGGTPTGRSVQSTAGELQIKWTTKDGKTNVFERVVNLDPSFLSIRTEGEVTDAMARQQVFAILKIQLAALPMPYFLSEDKELAVLPMSTTSEMASPASPQDALKKKIDAKKKMVKKGAN